MTRATFLALLAFPILAPAAADFTGFEPIGDVQNVRFQDKTVIITCRDRSEIAIALLADDLVRIRVAFRHPLPSRDQSWAIAKTDWNLPPPGNSQTSQAVIVSSPQLEVVVQRSPLLIEFRAVGRGIINADARPMMFNPTTGAVAAAKRFGFDEHFYGLGETASHLDKRRGKFTLWNTDAFGYKEDTDPIYQTIPFYIGWQKGEAYGIFYDNSYRSEFDFGNSGQDYVAFTAAGGDLDYYFFAGPSMKQVVSRYADLTGHIPMPPRWALGHQQSRYSYYPDQVVEQMVDRYRKDDLPLDAVHLDIHYMNGYRDFTWNPERFPNPDALIGKLKQQGVRTVVIVDPGIKYQPPAAAQDRAEHPELGPQDQSYYVYNQGKAGDYYLKHKDGSLYIPKVWPGDAVLVDYTLDAAARWWGGLFRAYTDHGVAGIWTDMNEPSDFNDQTGKSQMDVVFNDAGQPSTWAKSRNQFALNMARATYQGLERLRPGERPYVITRAGYAGIQRWSTVWTGDNSSTWESLALSIPMLQSVGLSGEAFAGADVGGFAGRADGELLVRWYEASFLAPFFRNHCMMESYDHEPWRFGPYYEDIIRKYLKLRYRLLPFLYTALEDAHRTGLPLYRPLLLNFQDDANTLSIDDEYMVGDDVLVAPVLQRGAAARWVYLPKGLWYDFRTGEPVNGGTMVRAEAGLDAVPLYVRGGAILTLGPEMNWTGEKPVAPVTLRIYPDAAGRARTSLYEDDGESTEYQRGVSRRLTASMEGGVVTIGAAEGSYRVPARELVMEMRGKASARVRDDGTAHRVVLQ